MNFHFRNCSRDTPVTQSNHESQTLRISAQKFNFARCSFKGAQATIAWFLTQGWVVAAVPRNDCNSYLLALLASVSMWAVLPAGSEEFEPFLSMALLDDTYTVRSTRSEPDKKTALVK